MTGLTLFLIVLSAIVLIDTGIAFFALGLAKLALKEAESIDDLVSAVAGATGDVSELAILTSRNFARHRHGRTGGVKVE